MQHLKWIVFISALVVFFGVKNVWVDDTTQCGQFYQAKQYKKAFPVCRKTAEQGLAEAISLIQRRTDSPFSATQTEGKLSEGGLRNGNAHSSGTKTFPDGSKYVGDWKNDKINGSGTLTWIAVESLEMWPTISFA